MFRMQWCQNLEVDRVGEMEAWTETPELGLGTPSLYTGWLFVVAHVSSLSSSKE